jgi:acyl-CoA thioester hydrolase
MSAENFRISVRVYYEDTDAGGVVYHANYVRYLERARTDWLRVRGIGQESLRLDRDIVFAITKMDLAFRLPARLDDLLQVSCELVRRGAASLEFRQDVVRASDNALLVSARVKAGCLAASTFRPRAIPDDLVLDASNC